LVLMTILQLLSSGVGASDCRPATSGSDRVTISTMECGLWSTTVVQRTQHRAILGRLNGAIRLHNEESVTTRMGVRVCSILKLNGWSGNVMPPIS